ncbi:MAG: S41 family peptidase, partial [bacterium]|nr:S41 family peptidase [bacterium]
AGTRSDQIIAVVGPAFGINRSADRLDLSSVQKTYQTLRSNYDGDIDTDKLVVGASKGLTAALGDKYTVYFDQKESEQFNSDLDGSIGGGIGAMIGLQHNQPTILQVLKNDPAEQAGLKDNDRIIAINGDTMVDKTVDDVVAKLRGKTGTTVKITVLRGSNKQTFSVTRDEITSPSVDSDIKGDVGVLSISRFDDETGSEARQAAEKMLQHGVKSVVLDLRNNGGGYVDAAQDVASLWLKDKVIVQERKGDKVVDTLSTTGTPILNKLPTVVLINANSASAAEIVAGALHDYKVATLLGEKSFGKGSVQTVIDMGWGNTLKVTIAKWYTPNGVNIMDEGIKPDIKVGITEKDVNNGKDVQLQAALDKLNKH